MAYRFQTDLDAALQAAGIPYTEVPATPIDPTGASSWRDRGRPHSTGEFDPFGVLCHHTASPATTTDRGDLNVIVAGNGDAPGPISQLYIGRSATCYLVAAGRANHGGKGAFPGGSCQDMNAALIGIEVGNNGTGEHWSDPVTNLYADVVAALLDWYGWDEGNVFLHATTGPPCGNHKIDPAGPWQRQPTLPGGGAGTWNLDTWRSFVSEHRGGVKPPEGNDLVHTLIRVRDSYVVLAGDMDAQGVVHWARWLGPGLNGQIGFQPDNVTPRIAGTKVLEREQGELSTISLVGPVPTGDLLAWSAANFYQAG